MGSQSAKATGNANQTSVQKEQFIANNVENIAPGGTEKNATTAGLKDDPKTRQIDVKEENEDAYDNEGSDDGSDSDSAHDDEEEDAPPTWQAYGARAKATRPIAGPKEPAKPIKGNNEVAGDGN